MFVGYSDFDMVRLLGMVRCLALSVEFRRNFALMSCFLWRGVSPSIG